MNKIRLMKWISISAGLVLCGCAEKLTYERFQTIEEGVSSRDAVEATLGKPWQKTGSEWIYHDPDRGITSSVFFEDDTVSGKTWADPDRGMVGQSPNVKQPGDADRTRVQKIE